MKTAIIAGASGLIGRELVSKLINSDQYGVVYIIARKKTGFEDKKIRELIIDFENLSQLTFSEPIDDVFCTLGTTMKKAASRENFKKIDYEYVIELAKLGKHAGASRFLVISSMGANPDSIFFYNQIKGLTEEDLKRIGYNRLVILRPSLLLGKRPEYRFAERMSAFFMNVFNFMIPLNYKAIKAEKVAEYMLKMALKSTGSVTIIKSADMQRG